MTTESRRRAIITLSVICLVAMIVLSLSSPFAGKAFNWISSVFADSPSDWAGKGTRIGEIYSETFGFNEERMEQLYAALLGQEGNVSRSELESAVKSDDNYESYYMNYNLVTVNPGYRPFRDSEGYAADYRKEGDVDESGNPYEAYSYYALDDVTQRNIVVEFGGLRWLAVYVSTATTDYVSDTDNALANDGDVILTLWLLDSGVTGQYGLYSDTNIGEQWSANMYGTSYVRAKLLNNGGQYATDNSTLVTAAQDSASMFAKFTMEQYYDTTLNMGVTSTLKDYLVSPRYLEWQHTQMASQMMRNPDGHQVSFRNFSSEAWGGVGQVSSNGRSSNGGNYVRYGEGAEYYDAWADDLLWLPSFTEMGEYGGMVVNGVTQNGVEPGLWNFDNNQRIYYTSSSNAFIGGYGSGTWFRSSHWQSFHQGWGIKNNGSPQGQLFSTAVTSSNLVRPALHLNLSKVETKTPDVTINITEQGMSQVKNMLSVTYGDTKLPTLTDDGIQSTQATWQSWIKNNVTDVILANESYSTINGELGHQISAEERAQFVNAVALEIKGVNDEKNYSTSGNLKADIYPFAVSVSHEYEEKYNEVKILYKDTALTLTVLQKEIDLEWMNIRAKNYTLEAYQSDDMINGIESSTYAELMSKLSRDGNSGIMYAYKDLDHYVVYVDVRPADNQLIAVGQLQDVVQVPAEDYTTYFKHMAGSYYIRLFNTLLTGADATNYKISEDFVDVNVLGQRTNISQVDPKTNKTIPADGFEVTLGDKVYPEDYVVVYNGMRYMPSITIKELNEDGYELVNGADFIVEYGENVNAGQGSVAVRCIGSYAGEFTLTFEIKRRQIGASISGSAVYDGAQKDATITFYNAEENNEYESPVNRDVQYTDSYILAMMEICADYSFDFYSVDYELTSRAIIDNGAAHANAGIYNVSVALRDIGTLTRNFMLLETRNSGIFTIEKASVTAPTVADLVYNGAKQTIVVDSDLYQVDDDGNTDVGNYDAMLVLTDPTNYKWDSEQAEDSDTITVPYSIVKRSITVTVNGSGVYGDEHSVNVTFTDVANQTEWSMNVSLSDYLALNSDLYEINFDEGALSSSSTVGNHIITIRLKGDADKNLIIVGDAGGLYSITPKPIRPGLNSRTSFVYNGTVQKPSFNEDTVAEWDTLFSHIEWSEQDSINAQIEAYTIAFTMRDTTNYMWDPLAQGLVNDDVLTISYFIAARKVEAHFDSGEAVFNGANQMPAITFEDGESDTPWSAEISIDEFIGANYRATVITPNQMRYAQITDVGTYELFLVLIDDTDEVRASNFDVVILRADSVKNKFEITKRTIYAEVSGATPTYNGMRHFATVSFIDAEATPWGLDDQDVTQFIASNYNLTYDYVSANGKTVENGLVYAIHAGTYKAKITLADYYVNNFVLVVNEDGYVIDDSGVVATYQIAQADNRWLGHYTRDNWMRYHQNATSITDYPFAENGEVILTYHYYNGDDLGDLNSYPSEERRALISGLLADGLLQDAEDNFNRLTPAGYYFVHTVVVEEDKYGDYKLLDDWHGFQVLEVPTEGDMAHRLSGGTYSGDGTNHQHIASCSYPGCSYYEQDPCSLQLKSNGAEHWKECSVCMYTTDNSAHLWAIDNRQEQSEYLYPGTLTEDGETKQGLVPVGWEWVKLANGRYQATVHLYCTDPDCQQLETRVVNAVGTSTGNSCTVGASIIYRATAENIELADNSGHPTSSYTNDTGVPYGHSWEITDKDWTVRSFGQDEEWNKTNSYTVVITLTCNNCASEMKFTLVINGEHTDPINGEAGYSKFKASINDEQLVQAIQAAIEQLDIARASQENAKFEAEVDVALGDNAQIVSVEFTVGEDSQPTVYDHVFADNGKLSLSMTVTYGDDVGGGSNNGNDASDGAGDKNNVDYGPTIAFILLQMLMAITIIIVVARLKKIRSSVM